MAESPGDGRVRLWVRGPEAVHRLVREYDAPAEGVVRPVALEDRHIPRGVRLLDQDREVKPCGTTTEAGDSHAALMVDYRRAAASFSPVSSANAAWHSAAKRPAASGACRSAGIMAITMS